MNMKSRGFFINISIKINYILPPFSQMIQERKIFPEVVVQ